MSKDRSENEMLTPDAMAVKMGLPASSGDDLFTKIKDKFPPDTIDPSHTSPPLYDSKRLPKIIKYYKNSLKK